MFKRTRYQFGWLRKKSRKRGPDVWVWVYGSTTLVGKRKENSVIVGSVRQYSSEADAWKAAEGLRLSINNPSPAEEITFGAVIDCYIREAIPKRRFLAVSSTTLPATERGNLLDNLGGSDPRSRRRWAAAKPLKVGSLPPKKRFSPRSSPNASSLASRCFFSGSICGKGKPGRKSKPKSLREDRSPSKHPCTAYSRISVMATSS